MSARRLLIAVILLVGLLATLVASPARAGSTIAVLPLTQAAGSTTYDGLGDAIAGMIVSDLSQVPELQLVERARLDALLAEIELSDSGFVDAETAQRLGRGAGAELVLLGTYSVLDARFLLDARIVRVEGGEVVKATAAQGTLDDFVTVEKDLVEGLIEGLDVAISSSLRRRLLTQAPTEAFDALTAYGEGLARERAGRLDEARAAYDRALAADPAFVEARRSLDRLQGALERSRARAAEASDSRRESVLAALVAGSPPPGKRTPADPEATAALFLRWMALTDQREDCVVAEEIGRWVRRRGWVLPERSERSAILAAVGARAESDRYEAVPRDIPAPAPAYQRPVSRAERFIDPKLQLALGGWFRKAPESDGLVGAITRCHRGEARPAALDAVYAEVRRLPAGTIEVRSPVPLEQELELDWAHWYAIDVGADATLERRVAAVIAATEGDDQARGAIQADVNAITADAREVGLRRIRRAGATPDQILAFARAVQAQDAAAIDLERSVCRQLVQNERPRGAVLLTALDQLEPETGSWHANLDQIALQRRTFAVVGCLRGTRATWGSAEAVRAGILARLAHLTPDARRSAACASTLASLDTQLSAEHVAKVKTWPSGEDSWTWAVLTMYLAIEGAGCVDVPGS